MIFRLTYFLSCYAATKLKGNTQTHIKCQHQYVLGEQQESIQVRLPVHQTVSTETRLRVHFYKECRSLCSLGVHIFGNEVKQMYGGGQRQNCLSPQRN